MNTVGLSVALLAAATTFVAAQAGTAPPSGAPPAPPAAAGDAKTPTPPEPYTYDPAGRRDPFVSLLARGLESGPTGKKGNGLSAWTTAEVMVRGVMQSRGAYVALLAGPDGKTHTAQANDRLLDGVIRSVTAQGIVIMQEVNDPLSLVKQREVRKGLRTAEDGK